MAASLSVALPFDEAAGIAPSQHRTTCACAGDAAAFGAVFDSPVEDRSLGGGSAEPSEAEEFDAVLGGAGIDVETAPYLDAAPGLDVDTAKRDAVPVAAFIVDG